jgi:CRISPR type I-E-associated protein CasB/Cse2
MSDLANQPAIDTRSVFYALAGVIRSRVLSNGELAQLRRMDPMRLDGGAFWKVAALHLDTILPGRAEARHRAETSWGAVLLALATLDDLQRQGERLGRSLALTGYSELRFVQLLRADHDRLLGEAPHVARFLKAKQHPADIVDLAVLLNGSDAKRDDTRRHLARDYYANLPTTP